MTANASTVVRRVPGQRSRVGRRVEPTQGDLFAQVTTGYCRAVDDTPLTWADYITWAAAQAGGVAALTRRTGLHRDTLFNWKSGANAHAPTIENVLKVADAVGDDRRRALLAAAQLADAGEPAPPDVPPAAGPAEPTLAEQLRRINDRIGQIAAMTGISERDRLEAITAQQEFADRLVGMYRTREARQASDRRTA